MQNDPYKSIGTPAGPSMEYDMNCNICYPDVYYKIQPFVMSVCDQIHTRGETVLSQEMFDQISDNIYEDVCGAYPDLVEYAGCYDMRSSVESLQIYFDEDRRDMDYDGGRRDRDRDRRDRDRRDRDRDRDGRDRFRFRRRGLFRDLIDLLLLNELLRRGRYYPSYPYYYYY